MTGRAAIVDPRFGAELRRLRSDRGLSLRELAKRAHYGKTYLHDLETGQARPSAEVAAHLDAALESGETLAALVCEPDYGLSPDDQERLAAATACPRRVDRAAVDALAGILSQTRRLEDAVGAGAVLAPVTTHLATLDDLVREARGPVRVPLVDVAAQWSQYAGWLAIATEHPARATALLDRAVALATEAQDADLAATALSFKGHAAYLAGQPGPVVTLFEAARRDPAVYVGQRAYDALQAARGYAMTGETRDAVRLLGVAADEDAATAEHAGPIPDWHYYRSAGFYLLERGIVYAHLGAATADRQWSARAIESVRAGLAAMPPDMRESEWTADHLLAVATAHLQEGDLAAAAAVLRDVRRIASAAGSGRLLRRVHDLSGRLSADTHRTP